MNLEIERKFFLTTYPSDLIETGELVVAGRKTIEQTYLALTETEELRVRKLTEDKSGITSYTHTYKRGIGLSREEAEYEIGSEIYHQLLHGSGRSPLVKTRTKVLADNKLFEIDEYHQFNLLTVEVEFTTEAEANAFAPPHWFGSEVGNAQEYRNKELWAAVQKA